MATQFVHPVGLHFPDDPPELEEGYEVQWRADGDPEHHYFCVQVSSLRLGRLVRDALELLPDPCQVVLEIRRTDEQFDADPDGPEHDRWVSDPVRRSEVSAVLERYEFQILHDGRVGFGVYDPESPFEFFLDDHKLINLFSPGLDPFEQLLARYHVPQREQLSTIVDVDHEHHTLSEIPDRCQVPAPEYLRHRRFDVESFGAFIRDRLHMKLTPSRWVEHDPGSGDPL